MFNKRDTYSQQGFTLIELMITVAIAAIVMAVAVPAFTNLIRDNKVIAAGNTLMSAINLARSEAIAQGNVIVACATDTPAAAVPVCGTDWRKGWVVYVQPANAIIKSGDPIPGIALSGASATTLNFNKQGRSVAADGVTTATATLIIVPDTCNSGVNVAVTLAVGTTGRVAFTKGTCS